MKILLCFGTRPEAIKMAPVIQELRSKGFDYKVCVTAQHREMLDQVLEFFDINPDYDLDIMKAEQELNALSALILEKLDSVIKLEKPDIILVQGDTTTAFLSAFAGFNRGIKVGHVEAGLRTYDRTSPFPEEGNRQLISKITDYHFTPTKKAGENLLKEAISSKMIFEVGNTIIDSLNYARKKLFEGYKNEEILKLSKVIKEKKIILVTGHRRENFGHGLNNLCVALNNISKRDDVQIIFPVHLNPQVKTLVDRELSEKKNIELLSPLQYPAFLWLMQKSALIITDSGGIQEEAPSFNIPVIVTRKLTERMEAIESGNSFIVDGGSGSIENKAKELLQGNIKPGDGVNPFGDGLAAERIVSILESLNVK